jgi:hypothetical protein
LRTGPYRLVSTLNGIPALEDIERVIQRGMPGTAMPSFADLKAGERKQLAQEAQRFYREGVREQVLAHLAREGVTVEEREVEQAVALRTTPGAELHVPPLDAAGPRGIARGKETYFHLGCHRCHGAEVTGAADMRLFDDQGRPAIPRDLVHDPLKGGQDPASLFRRIRLGMPGTPHPAVASIGDAELVDLVRYCLSLSAEPKRALTNHQRGLRAAHPQPVIPQRRPERMRLPSAPASHP